jgi:hypothetical protein
MSTAVLARTTRPRLSSAEARSSPDDDHLPHWSEVTPPGDAKPARGTWPMSVANVLADLVAWAADIGVVLTRGCAEDRAAIEGVRRYALAWLAGKPCRDVRIEDVLTTVATLLGAIDLDLHRTRGPSSAPLDAVAA